MSDRHSRRDGVWWAGLVVATAAAAATAHGLYAVAEASGIPWPVAGLYPVMADGLALVAYSATNRLTDSPRRYAWTVVVVAAGLSGAAQAMYLAGGGVDDAPTGVRFGIGAAPALAAAAVAHLLHLIRTAAGPVERFNGKHVEVVQPLNVATRRSPEVQRSAEAAPVRKPAPPATAKTSSALDRARRVAVRHQEQHGALPTASELVRNADVSRGTAGTVLKGLRMAQPEIPPPDKSDPGSDDHLAHLKSKIQNDHTPRHHDPEEDQLPTTGASR